MELTPFQLEPFLGDKLLEVSKARDLADPGYDRRGYVVSGHFCFSVARSRSRG